MKRYAPSIMLLLMLTSIIICMFSVVHRPHPTDWKNAHVTEVTIRPGINTEEVPPHKAPPSDCGAALVDLQKAYKGSSLRLDESLAREESLHKIIADLNRKLENANGVVVPRVPNTGKQIVDLPADAGNWYATLFVADNYEKHANQVAAVKMWNTSDWCRDLQAKCHGRLMKIGSKEARAYWPHIKATPALVLQDPNGLVVYSEVNPDLSKRPRQLVNSINSTMKKRKHCPDKFCPFIPPDQADKEEEDGKPEDVVVKPADKPAEKKTSAMPALVLGGIAFAVVYAVKFGVVAHRA